MKYRLFPVRVRPTIVGIGMVEAMVLTDDTTARIRKSRVGISDYASPIAVSENPVSRGLDPGRTSRV